VTSPNKIWLTSDTHFGHGNILGYCSRPFKDSGEMDEELIRRWNEKVGKKDLVYHLGDFAFGSKSKTAWYISRLNGEKNIILGNHDGYPTRWYMENGFMWASRFPIIYMEFILLSHTQQFLNPSSTFFNVHGHVHNGLPHRPNRQYMNVSVDVTDFYPVSLAYVLEEIKKEGGNVDYGKK